MPTPVDPEVGVAKLQLFLNNHGQGIKVDGIGGWRTRDAIFAAFRNRNAPRATSADKLKITYRLGGSLAQINAVSRVEAPRGGWDNSGLLTCLYERHYAWKRFQIQFPLLSSPKPGGYTIDVNNNQINDSWEKVADAACMWGPVAFEFASWGKFQIMGAWWEKLGYASVLDFVWDMTRSELAHYEALARYIEKFGLAKSFQALSIDAQDCREFARLYNGPAYTKHAYHQRLASAMKKEISK